SVASLCGSPASAGLFRRAVAQSGAASHVLTADAAAVIAEMFVAELGADPRTATAEALVDAQARTEAAFASDSGLRAAAGVDNLGIIFQPVVEPTILPVAPQQAVRDGASADVELLVGTNLDEFTMFLPGRVDEAHLERGLGRVFGEGAAEAEAAYRSRLGADASPTDVWLAVKADEVFRQPAIRLAEAHRGVHWMYLFTWPSSVGRLGSTHALEIPFVFDALDAPGVEPMTGGGAPQALADAMHGSWASFCRGDGPGWDAYDDARRATRVFGGLPSDGGADVTTVDDPLAPERQVWSARA
ncbi:MAG: carboxylesterase family protein, partial [Actinomycetota bacterium]|nr:carboxylesterase family protein [Actinomycetota bacterium]